MSFDLNTTILTGRIASNLELKHTTGGKAVIEFSIAVQKSKDEALFFTVRAWEKQAEYIAQHCVKGQRISVEGSLDTRTYEVQGVKRKVYEIKARPFGVRTLESAKARREAPARQKVAASPSSTGGSSFSFAPTSARDEDDDIPF